MNKRILGLFLLVGLLLKILFFQFGDIWNAKSDQLVTKGGDGMKNYITFLHHVKHDKNWWRYDGMNYPYGDHVLFTDNQPILANSVKAIKSFYPEILEYMVPIIHNSMLVSFVLSGVFLLLLFRQFNIPDGFAIPVSIGIVLLSPQFLRINGHFGLAMAVVIPMFIYALLLYEKNGRLLELFYLFCIILVSSLFHFYYLGILGLLGLGYAFFRVIYAYLSDVEVKWLPSIRLVVMVVVAIGVLKWWATIGLPVTDRPHKTLGFLYYRANWEGVFLHNKAPFLRFLHEEVIPFDATQYEGRVYIGLMSTALSMFLVIKWFLNKGKKPLFEHIQTHRLFVRSLFSVAFVLLLFSFAFPFTLSGMGKYVDYLGPLGQLRSVGRFAWVFFYVINIFGFTYLYKVLSNSESKPHLLVYLFPIVLLFADGFTFMSHINNKVHTLPELNKDFTQSNQYWFKDVSPADYQAILPVPFFHIGSEFYKEDPKNRIFFQSSMASLLSGLPNMGVLLARTSLSQSEKILGTIYTAGYRIPKVLTDFPNQKPLLAFVVKEAMDAHWGRYQFVRDYGTVAFETDKIIGYRLPLSIFAQAVQDSKMAVKSEIINRKLYDHGELKSTDSLKNYMYFSFDSSLNEHRYFGEGAFQSDDAILAEKQILFDGPMPNPKNGAQYDLTFWIYIGDETGPKKRVRVIEYKETEPTKMITECNTGVYEEIEVMHDGWAYYSKELTLRADDSKIKIELFNSLDKQALFWVDELLFRPVGTDLYKGRDGKYWKNGLYFE